MKKFFVTGIGTDVGKTVISAILAEALQADYWKPVQTGSFFSTDSEIVRRYITNTKTFIHPEAYILKQNMSPHAAAELEGKKIVLENINLPHTTNTLIIEGAGGLMVPLNDNEFMVDIILKTQAEVVLVIQNYLGSINHSILTIDALRYRKINVFGIVFNGPPHQLSEDILLSYSNIPCVGRLNKESVINKEVVLAYANLFRSNFI